MAASPSSAPTIPMALRTPTAVPEEGCYACLEGFRQPGMGLRLRLGPPSRPSSPISAAPSGVSSPSSAAPRLEALSREVAAASATAAPATAQAAPPDTASSGELRAGRRRVHWSTVTDELPSFELEAEVSAMSSTAGCPPSLEAPTVAVTVDLRLEHEPAAETYVHEEPSLAGVLHGPVQKSSTREDVSAPQTGDQVSCRQLFAESLPEQAAGADASHSANLLKADSELSLLLSRATRAEAAEAKAGSASSFSSSSLDPSASSSFDNWDLGAAEETRLAATLQGSSGPAQRSLVVEASTSISDQTSIASVAAEPKCGQPLADVAPASLSLRSPYVDTPGTYIVFRRVGVSPSMAPPSGRHDFIERLDPGCVVEVLEVALAEKRTRGRILYPSGWISLCNLETGYRWANQCNELDAQPNPQAEDSSCPESVHMSACCQKLAQASTFSMPAKIPPVPFSSADTVNSQVTAFAEDNRLERGRQQGDFSRQVTAFAEETPLSASMVSAESFHHQRCFRVRVPKPYPGIQLRRSKALDDKHLEFARHGAIVYGCVEDNGAWLRVSGSDDLFLPMRMGATEVLVSVPDAHRSAACCSSPDGRRASPGAPGAWPCFIQFDGTASGSREYDIAASTRARNGR